MVFLERYTLRLKAYHSEKGNFSDTTEYSLILGDW